MLALAVLLVEPGLTVAATLTPEQETSLEEVRQMIRGAARVYGPPAAVDVTVVSWVGSPTLPSFAAAGAVATGDRLYLAPGALGSRHRDTLIATALASRLLYRASGAKDSVDVDAHMGSVELAFTAHNPGDWFFHCHKPMHMEGGMITLAKIG